MPFLPRKRLLKIPDALAMCSAIILLITALIEPSAPPTQADMLAGERTDLEVSGPGPSLPAQTPAKTDVESHPSRPPMKISRMLFRWP